MTYKPKTQIRYGFAVEKTINGKTKRASVMLSKDKFMEALADSDFVMHTLRNDAGYQKLELEKE